MNKHKAFTAAILLFAVLLSACGAVNTSETTAPAAASGQEETLTAGASAEAESTEEPEPSPEPTPEPTPSLPAEKLEAGFNRADAAENLSDGDVYSYEEIDGVNVLEISSADGTPVSALYAIWYRRPSALIIEYPDGSVSTVDENMLHQVIRLDKPSSSVKLRPSDREETLKLSELSLYTEGVLPKEVQDWKKLGVGEADICLFPTHADDEYVFFGGLLPYYAGELGYKVQVCWTVCHDDHYIRNHELLNALWKSGCVYYPEINYETEDVLSYDLDEALLTYSFAQFEEYEVEMIRKYRPLIVVGHDEKGEYGHGAHILSSLTLERAVSDAANPAAFRASSELYGAWEVQKAYIHLYGKKTEQTIISLDTPLTAFGGQTAYEAAMACYREHYSQYSQDIFTVFREDSLYDSQRYGLWLSTVGDDVKKDDLLENVDFTVEKKGVMYEPTQLELNAEKMISNLVGDELLSENRQKGTVESRSYVARDVQGGTEESKNMLVYLPYGYDTAKKYNVLILSQGSDFDETAWFAENTDETGRKASLKCLLDNMIASGECEPLIVVSVSWANSASCALSRFDMDDLEVSSAQQAAEMRNDILPFIINNYSTYAAGTDSAAITKARDHFAYAGMAWGGMTGILGLAAEDNDCISWFAAFGSSHFDMLDTPDKLDAAAGSFPVNYLLFCTGSDDDAIKGGKAVYEELTSQTASLTDGYNCRFIEIKGGDHWFGSYLSGIYNALQVFFTSQ